MTDELLRVGELAKRTGLTVRTLHFYDEVGLLHPACRTESGHRLYDASCVAQLQRIVSLRQLGLSLEEIADLLEGRETALPALLSRHAAHLRAQARAAEALAARLTALAGQLAHSPKVTVDELLQTVQETVMYEVHYTKEQLAELEARRQKLGEEGMAQVHQEWGELIAAAKQAQADGLPATDPKVQAIARRWKELIEMFTGGNPGIRQSLERTWQQQPDAMARQTGVDAGLREYMQEAMRGA